MLTTPELVSMRSTVESILTDICTITTPGTPTVNENGEEVPGTPTSTTSACRLSYLGGSGGEAVRAQRLVNNTPWTVTLPYGTVPSLTATITVNGKTLQVNEVISGQTVTLCVKVACSELE